MQKNIQFNSGIHRAPSTSVSEGELSECINLIPKNGELVNIRPAEEMGITIPDGARLLAVHDTDMEKHYICEGELRGSVLCWEEGDVPDYEGRLKCVYVYSRVPLVSDVTIAVKRSSDFGPAVSELHLAKGWNGSAVVISYNISQTLYSVMVDNSDISLVCLDTEEKKQKYAHGDYDSGKSIFYLDKNNEPHQICSNIENVSSVTMVGKVCCLSFSDGIVYLLWDSEMFEYNVLRKDSGLDFDINFRLNGGLEGVHLDNIDVSMYIDYKPELFTKHVYTHTFHESPRETQVEVTEDLRSRGALGKKLLVVNHGTEGSIVQVSNSSLGIEFTHEIHDREVVDMTGWGRVYINYGNLGSISFYDTDVTNHLGGTIIPDEKFYEAVTGATAEYINTYYHNKKKFIFPFFVRWGLTMFDNSVINLSEPVLMLPNSDLTPIVMVTGRQYYEKAVALDVMSYACDLKVNVNIPEYARKWKSLIKGVAIYISFPIYKYNQATTYNKDTIRYNLWQYFDATGGGEPSVVPSGLYYGLCNEGERRDFLDDNTIMGRYILRQSQYSDEEYKENILKASSFRKIKEYTWDEIEKIDNQWEVVDLSSVSLRDLATLPTISDDYNSKSIFIPGTMFPYNNRLNICNIKELVGKPVSPVSPMIGTTKNGTAVFYIEAMGKTLTVNQEVTFDPAVCRWIYFPNVNAKKCVIAFDEYVTDEIPLTTHPWMNGAYAYNADGFNYHQGSLVIPPEQRELSYPNAIYASQQNNPFFFPVLTQTFVGTGEITAVSTSAKALSQGQFGQFPLYAFATDGIWSLSVDAQGRYASTNPVVRDIVTNRDSICQIDSAVVYADSQGLKLLQGSDSQLISAAIEGFNVDESKFLSGMDSEHASLIKQTDKESIINVLSKSRIMYDNAGHRWLHIFPEGWTDTHLVYSIDADAWSMATNTPDIKSVVHGYPFSIIQGSDNKLRQYTNIEDNNTMRYGFLLTREMCFDDPFVLKVLEDLRMVYSSRNEELPAKCRIRVFVSNDRKRWITLGSLRAHSYKWYRFRIQTSLTDLDALTMLTLQYNVRQTNRLR